jgi:hypothetical protein
MSDHSICSQLVVTLNVGADGNYQLVPVSSADMGDHSICSQLVVTLNVGADEGTVLTHSLMLNIYKNQSYRKYS